MQLSTDECPMKKEQQAQSPWFVSICGMFENQQKGQCDWSAVRKRRGEGVVVPETPGLNLIWTCGTHQRLSLML